MKKSSPRILALVASVALVAACSSSSDSRDGLTKALTEVGFSESAAECVLDSLDSQGIDVDGLRPRDVSDPDTEMRNAFGQAGADCTDQIGADLDGLDDSLLDMSDPLAREQFVRQFALGSGLSEDVGDCVFDYFVDNDVSATDLLSESPEMEATTLDALEACGVDIDSGADAITEAADGGDASASTGESGAALVLDSLIAAGFSEDAATCVIDSVEAQGVDLDDLEEDDLEGRNPELESAFEQAGEDCVDHF